MGMSYEEFKDHLKEDENENNQLVFSINTWACI